MQYIIKWSKYNFSLSSYSGSGCSKCSCTQFVISDDPQYCDGCGHSRSSHYGK